MEIKKFMMVGKLMEIKKFMMVGKLMEIKKFMMIGKIHDDWEIIQSSLRIYWKYVEYHTM